MGEGFQSWSLGFARDLCLNPLRFRPEDLESPACRHRPKARAEIKALLRLAGRRATVLGRIFQLGEESSGKDLVWFLHPTNPPMMLGS